MMFEAVIGLEVHAQLLTSTKIFCACSTQSAMPPNTNTCPVCMGMPGVLPVLNRKVVDFGIMLGHATGCCINPMTEFSRKNYFYPDLPKGYQITQHTTPLCSDGHLDIESDGNSKRIRIMRIHMEEDAGKSLHMTGEPHTCLDYNRSGVPLLEIVSEPDMRSGEEAAAYLRELRQVLMYLGICDGTMEEGSFRCDANISLKKPESDTYGTRTEIKNMNSFRNVQKAIDYEISRQRAILESGGEVVQETRLFNASDSTTAPMRSKEESHDYRYFPEPDLLPVVVDDAWIKGLESTMPELPAVLRKRLLEVYGLPAYDAGVLTQTKALAYYFEECAQGIDAPKDISNWIMTEVLRILNETGMSLSSFPVKPAMLADLISLVHRGDISGHMAKEVFSTMALTGRTAQDIVQEKGLSQLSDEAMIAEKAKEIIEAFPEEAARYRNGKVGLLSFFVGRLMGETKGKANPKLANRIMKDMLDKPSG